MKHPSKRVKRIAGAEGRRLAAVESNDVEAFALAIAEIQEIESGADLYTCASCGLEFPDGPHVDLLVASILVFDASGVVSESADYGLLATERRENGRRFKFCNTCVGGWAHAPLEYAEL